MFPNNCVFSTVGVLISLKGGALGCVCRRCRRCRRGGFVYAKRSVLENRCSRLGRRTHWEFMLLPWLLAWLLPWMARPEKALSGRRKSVFRIGKTHILDLIPIFVVSLRFWDIDITKTMCFYNVSMFGISISGKFGSPGGNLRLDIRCSKKIKHSIVLGPFLRLAP